MRSEIANRFGVAGGTIAVLAVAAYAYAITLPYRLSQSQSALLDVAFIIQTAGAALAIGLSCAALRGDARSRRFGFVAIAISVITLLLALVASRIHSMSRW